MMLRHAILHSFFPLCYITTLRKKLKKNFSSALTLSSIYLYFDGVWKKNAIAIIAEY